MPVLLGLLRHHDLLFDLVYWLLFGAFVLVMIVIAAIRSLFGPPSLQSTIKAMTERLGFTALSEHLFRREIDGFAVMLHVEPSGALEVRMPPPHALDPERAKRRAEEIPGVSFVEGAFKLVKPPRDLHALEVTVERMVGATRELSGAGEPVLQPAGRTRSFTEEER